jgi:hypothetical protein
VRKPLEERVLKRRVFSLAVNHVILLGGGAFARHQADKYRLPDAVGAHDLRQLAALGRAQAGQGDRQLLVHGRAVAVQVAGVRAAVGGVVGPGGGGAVFRAPFWLPPGPGDDAGAVDVAGRVGGVVDLDKAAFDARVILRKPRYRF